MDILKIIINIILLFGYKNLIRNNYLHFASSRRNNLFFAHILNEIYTKTLNSLHTKYFWIYDHIVSRIVFIRCGTKRILKSIKCKMLVKGIKLWKYCFYFVSHNIIMTWHNITTIFKKKLGKLNFDKFKFDTFLRWVKYKIGTYFNLSTV